MSKRIWTAADLEAKSPGEIDALFRESIAWDLDDVPGDIVHRARQRALARIQQTERTEQP